MVVEHKPYYSKNNLGRLRLVSKRPKYEWRCKKCGAFCGYAMKSPHAGIIRSNAHCPNPNCDQVTEQECIPIE